MDKDQIKKLFANPQVCNGCVNLTLDAWNVMAREVNKAITELEKENLQLRAELEAMADVKELEAVGLPGINIETMNVTVNCYADLK